MNRSFDKITSTEFCLTTLYDAQCLSEFYKTSYLDLSYGCLNKLVHSKSRFPIHKFEIIPNLPEFVLDQI